MSINEIKRDLRDRIMDALEAGEPLTKQELRQYVKRRANDLSFNALRDYAAMRIVAECVGQIKHSHRMGWQVNGRPVEQMAHNVEDMVMPEPSLVSDQAELIMKRNEANLKGRMVAHAEMVQRFERRHPLSADAIRRRRKLEQFIFSF